MTQTGEMIRSDASGLEFMVSTVGVMRDLYTDAQNEVVTVGEANWLRLAGLVSSCWPQIINGSTVDGLRVAGIGWQLTDSFNPEPGTESTHIYTETVLPNNTIGDSVANAMAALDLQRITSKEELAPRDNPEKNTGSACLDIVSRGVASLMTSVSFHGSPGYNAYGKLYERVRADPNSPFGTAMQELEAMTLMKDPDDEIIDRTIVFCSQVPPHLPEEKLADHIAKTIGKGEIAQAITAAQELGDIVAGLLKPTLVPVLIDREVDVNW